MCIFMSSLAAQCAYVCVHHLTVFDFRVCVPICAWRSYLCNWIWAFLLPVAVQVWKETIVLLKYVSLWLTTMVLVALCANKKSLAVLPSSELNRNTVTDEWISRFPQKHQPGVMPNRHQCSRRSNQLLAPGGFIKSRSTRASCQFRLTLALSQWLIRAARHFHYLQ